MVGLNLSSSIAEKKEITISDSSLAVISIIFFLVVAGFGGLRWYIKTLDNKLMDLEASLNENASRLRGDKVNRVAYFDARLRLIEQQLNGDAVDSKRLLGQMESLVLPNVRLTKYEYNETGKFVVVSGETENFKNVAQQIISLKSEDLFTGIKVESIQRTEGGQIGFSFKAQF